MAKHCKKCGVYIPRQVIAYRGVDLSTPFHGVKLNSATRKTGTMCKKCYGDHKKTKEDAR